MSTSLKPSLFVVALILLSLSPSHASSPFPQPQPQTSLPTATSSAVSTGGPPPEVLLMPILTSLGFQELSIAVPSLSSVFASSAVLSGGPITVFAPSDDSIRSCLTCSAAGLLREHIVPGLFSLPYLTKLAFGTKIETASAGRCITVTASVNGGNSTSSSASASASESVRIYIDGVEITRPEIYNDGRIVVHGIEGYVAPLTPLSCNRDGLASPNLGPAGTGSTIVRLMLRDAMVRLRDGGYSILALAMRVKYAELSTLRNMTIFALDDSSIFGGGLDYVSNVRFHVVPDRLLARADLEGLPVGSTLPTLVEGESLTVTHAAAAGGGGGAAAGSALRINYVPIKNPDVVINPRIAVHGIFLPFPHLQPSISASAVLEEGLFDGRRMSETCGGERSLAWAPVPAAGFDVDEGL
ncbi:hypothetical protein QJS04_geneDACA006255 [Acorus gramineus]|uniref:FAS1 domain-containing protein n=1 Tax=Acorus gramineus TaxID=55184 RepID=A0AAV9AXV3_ACOGR|nr:hypothetical protein QJS04_geneDACA006255 [Acorus gramineus]